MSDINEKTLTREEFNQALVRALEDLVADARDHEARIKASFDRCDEVFRRVRAANEEAGRNTVNQFVARGTPPHRDILDRLDRIELALTEMRSQMATRGELQEIRRTMASKVELEAMNDKIKMVADGYRTISRRLDQVAELLKVRVVIP